MMMIQKKISQINLGYKVNLKSMSRKMNQMKKVIIQVKWKQEKMKRKLDNE